MPRVPLPLFAIVLASTACSGPRDATPMPEPPSMDLSKVGPSEGAMVAITEYTDAGGAPPTNVSLVLKAQPGFAPPGTELLVTHLDGPEAPTAISILDDGSFEAAVYGDYGNEFRFQLVDADRRVAPTDAFYLLPATGAPYFSRSLRHDCLRLTPGFEVTFRDMGVSTLRLDNGCDGAITVANARSRTGSLGSRSFTVLPLEIAPRGSASLSLEYQGSAFESSEDTLFIDVTLEGRAIRYPITLFAP